MFLRLNLLIVVSPQRGCGAQRMEEETEMNLNELGVLNPSLLFPRRERWLVLAQLLHLWVQLIQYQMDQL